MPNTIARIKKAGKHFEIIVDLENALKFKKGEIPYIEAEGDRIFRDSKKGDIPSRADLEEAFKTTDVNTIVQKIVKEGEVQVNQEYRDEEHEKRFKQAVDFLVKNAIDPQTGNPFTTERIKNALEQSHIIIKNTAIENQISDILAKISQIIPIKIETKKVKIIVPAIYTGQAYGMMAQYKDQEKWLNDGSLEVIVNVPAGMIMSFFDKLNSITRGSALTENIKE